MEIKSVQRRMIFGLITIVLYFVLLLALRNALKSQIQISNIKMNKYYKTWINLALHLLRYEIFNEKPRLFGEKANETSQNNGSSVQLISMTIAWSKMTKVQKWRIQMMDLQINARLWLRGLQITK